MEDGAICLLGLLLFGKEEALRRYVPLHRVMFQELNGTRVGVNECYCWPLLRAFEEVVAHFRHRMHATEVFARGVRVQVADYDDPAFREAVANAMVHRDYHDRAAIHVQWHHDHLRIDSPGGFPEGVHLDNLLVTQPRPRNPKLADAFKRAGLVESTGRGIDLIFEGQLRFGRDLPDYAISTRSSVTVILPGGPANLGFTRFVAEQGLSGVRLRVAELLVLNHLVREGSITVEKAAGLCQQIPERITKTLDHLTAAELITAVDQPGGPRFKLTAQAAEAIAEPPPSASWEQLREVEPDRRETRTPKTVFISYSQEQNKWVWDRLLPCLDAGGATVLIDGKHFEAGKALVDQMGAAQDQADLSVLVLSPEYLKSAHCRHEMERALAADPDLAGGVIPSSGSHVTTYPTPFASGVSSTCATTVSPTSGTCCSRHAGRTSAAPHPTGSLRSSKAGSCSNAGSR